MIDKKARMQEAERFKREGDCYIHTEMKGGGNCETILAGDGLAILHGINAAISRLARISGSSYDATLETLRDMNHAAERADRIRRNNQS